MDAEMIAKRLANELLPMIDPSPMGDLVRAAIAALYATPQADRAAVLNSHIGYVVDGVHFYHPDFPREEWGALTYRLIEHGRAICDAKRPVCGQCVLAELCPSAYTVKGWREQA